MHALAGKELAGVAEALVERIHFRELFDGHFDLIERLVETGAGVHQQHESHSARSSVLSPPRRHIGLAVSCN